MNYAIYNPTTNTILTWVTEPKGFIPEGYEFRETNETPKDAITETNQQGLISVPEEVPMWALKELCLIRKHATDIQNALNNLPEPTKTIALNRWDNKDTISRNSQIIAAMRVILKWTNEYVDELFIAADSLSKS
jgi:hypothetical protein